MRKKMIDRKARNRLAEEIRHFVECFTDNFEFDDAIFELETEDHGVNAIYGQMWLTYDDLKRHKLEGEWALNESGLTVVKRAIVFLKSDFEYRWPKWPFYYKAFRPFIWLFSLGKATKRLDERFNGYGNLEVWPFFSSEEYESALQQPRYMANTHNTYEPPRRQ
jgi:hypothetical protein